MIIHAHYVEPFPPLDYPPCDAVALALMLRNPRKHHAASQAQSAAQDALDYMRRYRQPINGMDRPLFYSRLLAFYIHLSEIFDMPRKPTNLPSAPREDLTFLNVRLTEEELQDCDSLKITASQLLQMVVTAIENGYRFSFSYNPDRQTANAMFVDTRVGRASRGYALSAFSDDCADALKLLCYKHYNKLAGEWAEVMDKPSSRSTRG